jgi:DnaJ-class molecular chaperone
MQQFCLFSYILSYNIMTLQESYKILGLTSDATEDEIKKAYKKLAMKHHPDREGGNEEKFKQIKEAYEVLTNKNQDLNQDQFQSFHDIDLSNLFSQFRTHFNGFSGYNQPNQPPKKENRSYNVNIQLELEETLSPQIKYVQVKKTNKEPEYIRLDIPEGVMHGQRLKYPNLGDDTHKDLPKGDLYITIYLNLPPEYQLLNTGDVCLSKKISCFDAALGTTIEVSGIDKKTFEVSVPAGTQHGSWLSLAGQGIKIGQIRKNIMIQVLIEIPKLDTKESISQYIEKLNSSLNIFEKDTK